MTEGFRGARSLTPEDTEFFRRHHQAVNEAISRAAKVREERIRELIRELGCDPDSPETLPQIVIDHISERMALGEFDGPLHVIIPEETPDA